MDFPPASSATGLALLPATHTVIAAYSVFEGGPVLEKRVADVVRCESGDQTCAPSVGQLSWAPVASQVAISPQALIKGQEQVHLTAYQAERPEPV